MKKQGGITLITLVVTIIILIILAGVSINILLGEQGIITIAQQAKENMQIAQLEEQKNLNQLQEQLTGYDTGSTPNAGESGELTNKLEELQNKFDSLQTEYDTFKSSIVTAITEKGVETSTTDSIDTIVANIKKLNSSGSSYSRVGEISHWASTSANPSSRSSSCAIPAGTEYGILIKSNINSCSTSFSDSHASIISTSGGTSLIKFDGTEHTATISSYIKSDSVGAGYIALLILT